MKVSQKPTFDKQSRPTKKTVMTVKLPIEEVKDACKMDKIKVIKKIAKNHGVDTLYEDFLKKRTMLGIAASNGKINIMQYLMKKGAKIGGDELAQICRNANLEVIKTIVEKFGVDAIYLCERSDERLTLLEIATRSEKITIMKFLIDYGANIEGFHLNRTTIEKAIFWDCDTSVVKLLIENGAKARNTLIGQAMSSSNSFSMVKLLLDCGLDLNVAKASRWNNENVLTLAKRNHYYDIVDLMEKKLQEQRRPSKKTRRNQSEQSMIVPKKQIELDDCMVCFDPIKIPCAFNPCGHAKACEACCLKITKAAQPTCPLCRSAVVNYLKIFF